MSSNNTTTNNTSTSRSGKKGKRYTKLDLSTVDAQPEVKVEAPAQVTQPTPEVKVEETRPAEETKPAESVAELPKAPVVNVWKLRAEAQAAAEALKKAEEAIQAVEKAAKEAESAPKPQPVQPTKTKAPQPTKPEDDGFIPVTSKKAYKKPQGQQQDKPKSQPQTKVQPQEHKTQEKKAYKPRVPTEEEKQSRQRYAKAFDMAQERVVASCLAACSTKTRDDINASIRYIVNYRRTLVVDVHDDDVVVELDGEKFAFSATRFLENFKFQAIVRERYAKVIPDAWIRFFPGREDGTYCIGVQLRRS